MTDVSVADNLVCFYKYRYTFDVDTTLSMQKSVANQILADIRPYMTIEKYTLGIEYYTKGMQVAKPHLHIHFMSKHPAKNIREKLRANHNMIGRVQACKAEVLVDEEKFWRYPLKQQKSESQKYHRTAGFTEDEVKHMVDVAYSCWKQAAEVECAKQSKREERSGKDRLFAYLDTVIDDNMTLRDCRIESYKYYVEFEDGFSQPTVKGYAYMYALKKGIISFEEFDDLMGV